MTATHPPTSVPISAALRDKRVLQWVGQILFTLVLIVLVYALITSIVASLRARNLTPNFSFLQTTGGFDLSEAPAWYNSTNTYWEAFQVGIINTLRVVTVGLVATTILGVFVGIFLLSSNWLVRTLSRAFVELIRNTPLLVQLFAWYFIVMFSLPTFQQSLAFPPESMTAIPVRLLLYLALAFAVWRYSRRHTHHDQRVQAVTAALAALIFVVEIGFWLNRTQPGWRGANAGSNFILYVAISLILIGVIWFARPLNPRSLAPGVSEWLGALRLDTVVLGLAVGQLIGGLLLFVDVVPANVLRFELHPVVYVNIRGFAFPELLATTRFAEWMAFVGIGIALAAILWLFLGHRNEVSEDDERVPRLLYTLLAVVVFAVVGWLIVTSEPAPATIPIEQEGQVVYMPLEEAREQRLIRPRDEVLYSQAPVLFLLPQRSNFRFEVGTQISPEYMALLLGLVVYTAAFIAEIVRAGIQAVPRGQVEAARALGLTTSQVLRLVILPQALRVIIPPLGNQYLNLTKNSSLATAVAFSDIYLVSITMAGTSGQSVPIIIMVMLTYLVMSLTIATVMNWVNRRFQLVTR